MLAARNCSHNGYAQRLRKRVQVHINPLFTCLIQKIHTNQNVGRDFQRLKDQIQIPLQTGSVADDQNAVGAAEAEKIPGNLLFGRMGHQRVGSGNIRQDQTFSMPEKKTLGAVNGFSGPVSCMLFPAGQIVEQSAFADIGISGYCNDRSFLWFKPLSFPLLGNNMNVAAVLRAEGNDSPADQVGLGVAPWTGSQTFHLSILYQTKV